jgi:hypothetical protein
MGVDRYRHHFLRLCYCRLDTNLGPCLINDHCHAVLHDVNYRGLCRQIRRQDSHLKRRRDIWPTASKKPCVAAGRRLAKLAPILRSSQVRRHARCLAITRRSLHEYLSEIGTLAYTRSLFSSKGERRGLCPEDLIARYAPARLQPTTNSWRYPGPYRSASRCSPFLDAN